MRNGSFKINIRITIVLAVVILMLCVYFNIDPEDSLLGRYFPKCPVKMLTGLQCPGCGVQRAAHSLLHGELGEALSYNLFLPVSVGYVILLLISRSMLPEGSATRQFLWGKWGAGIYICLYLVWFVVRNILGI